MTLQDVTISDSSKSELLTSSEDFSKTDLDLMFNASLARYMGLEVKFTDPKMKRISRI